MTTDTAPRHAATPSDSAFSAAPGSSSGALIVAWQNPSTRLISPVGLLEHGRAGYRFRYLRRAGETPDFRPFLSFPDLNRTYTSGDLFPLFSQRVMSSRRRDFREFVRQLALSEDEAVSPWEQLARSGGRTQGDTVQLFPVPKVGEDGRTSCLFLVHGIRHVTGGELPPLEQGQVLSLRPDSDNRQYPHAVLVCLETGEPLGYVPDLLLEYLRVLRDTDEVNIRVAHVNGAEAPPHLRLLVRMDGRAPLGYQPMTGSGWETY